MLASGDGLKNEGNLQVNMQSSVLKVSSFPEPSLSQLGGGGSPWLAENPSRNLSELLKGQGSWQLFTLYEDTLGHL